MNMKKNVVLCVGVCAALALTGCKSSESAYKKAYLKAQAQQENNLNPSTFWMKDGSFLRFKTLEVGYTFPHCRVYVSGDNLAVWSTFKYWDPELQYSTYPLSRTFNVGVQVNF